MQKLLKISMLIVAGLIISCKKDDNTVVPNPGFTNAQKRNALTTGYWSLTKVNGQIFTQECSKDDKLIFKNDGNLVIDNGAVKCNLEPDQYLGTFTLDTVKTAYIARKVTIPAQGSTPLQVLVDTLDVIKLDTSTLELQFRNDQKTLQTYQKKY